MNITVYATRYTRTPDEARMGLVDNLAVLGYPVVWTLEQTDGALEVVLTVADGSKVWQNKGKVWIDEGNNAGVLRTFNGQPTLTIGAYSGDVNKSLRIVSIG